MANKEKVKTPLLDALMPRRRAFVIEYLNRFHPKEAALKAGYAKATAHEKSKSLLEEDEIRAALSEVLEVKAGEMESARAAVVARLFAQTMVSIADLTKWDEKNRKLIPLDPDEVDANFRTCLGFLTVSREGFCVFNQGMQLQSAKLLQSYMLWDKHTPDLLPAVSFDFSGLKLDNYEHSK